MKLCNQLITAVVAEIIAIRVRCYGNESVTITLITLIIRFSEIGSMLRLPNQTQNVYFQNSRSVWQIRCKIRFSKDIFWISLAVEIISAECFG